MTLRLVDSFDTYATADISRRYTVSATPAIDAVEMRTGVGCLKCDSYTDCIITAITCTDDKFVVGFAFKTSALVAGDIFRTMGSATINLTLHLNDDGTFSLKRSTVIIDTSVTALLVDTWYHIELVAQVSNSTTIECILKVDGTTILTLPTSTDTMIAGGLTGIRLGKFGIPSMTCYFDSYYFMDQDGSTNNTFLGDCVVEAILPDGNGYNSDFDGSDGNQVDNYLLVDEADPDDDTTYVEDDTVGGIDSFTYAAMSETPATIFGVAVTTMAKKTTANARTIKQIARPVSTNYTGDEHTLSESYACFQDIWEDNPADAAAWEEADVNGAEFGVKVEA